VQSFGTAPLGHEGLGTVSAAAGANACPGSIGCPAQLIGQQQPGTQPAFPGPWHPWGRHGRPDVLWPKVSVQAACPLKGNLVVPNLTVLHTAASRHCRQKLLCSPLIKFLAPFL